VLHSQTQNVLPAFATHIRGNRLRLVELVVAMIGVVTIPPGLSNAK
jgi:hypothetical protein